MLRRSFLFSLLCVLIAAVAAQARQLALVADKASTTSNISSTELQKILSGHSRNWPDGKAITIVIRDPSSADMQLVLHKLLNMSDEQLRSVVQAHRDMIVVADSDQAIIRFVAGKRGAIGLIDLYSLTKDVNVMKIDGKLPVEPGYLLKGN